MTQFIYRGISEKQKEKMLARKMLPQTEVDDYMTDKVEERQRQKQEEELAFLKAELEKEIVAHDTVKKMFGVEFPKGQPVEVAEGSYLHAKLMGMAYPKIKSVEPCFDVVGGKPEPEPVEVKEDVTKEVEAEKPKKKAPTKKKTAKKKVEE